MNMHVNDMKRASRASNKFIFIPIYSSIVGDKFAVSYNCDSFTLCNVIKGFCKQSRIVQPHLGLSGVQDRLVLSELMSREQLFPEDPDPRSSASPTQAQLTD